MSFLTYKMTIEIPLISPSGELPSCNDVIVINDTLGEEIVMDPNDAERLTKFMVGAWNRGRPLN